GFTSGVSGDELLSKLRTQAEGYGTQITRGRIVELARADGGFAALDDERRRYRATHVLLATGIVDRMPSLGGSPDALEAAIRTGALRLCAVCDGYEASDETIAVYGPVDE